MDLSEKFHHHKRTFIKSLIFRVLTIASDTLVVSFITKEASDTFAIIILTNLSSTVLYYFHERVWARTAWRIVKLTGFEHISRSVIKAVTFRILVIVADLIIAAFVTKSAVETLGIIVFTNLASTIIYFVYERVWNRINLHTTRKHSNVKEAVSK